MDTLTSKPSNHSSADKFAQKVINIANKMAIPTDKTPTVYQILENNSETAIFQQLEQQAQLEQQQAITQELQQQSTPTPEPPLQTTSNSKDNNDDDDEWSVEELKNNIRRNEIRTMTRDSRVPKIFRDKHARDFIITDQNKIAIDAMAAIKHNQGLYIYGDCGTGKTLLASIILNERARLLKPSIFLCATDIFLDLNPFNGNQNTANEKRIRYKSIPCLIIDDLGVEKTSDWTKQTLFDIINHRYNENLQTIITSNFSPDALRDRLTETTTPKKQLDDYVGDRIIRRIKAICKIIHLPNY